MDTPKKYRPDPHAKYTLQLLSLPLILILIAAIRYVLVFIPTNIVNSICLLFLLISLLCIFILLPLWFRNTSYTITEQDIISVTGIFIHREKRMRLRALQCSTIIQMPFCQYTSQPAFNRKYGLWQYSSTGRIAGIQGNVDQDFVYLDCERIIKNAHLNGF